MKKVYTTREIAGQQTHMWNGVKIEDEVSSCPGRRVHAYFFNHLPKTEPVVEAGCGLGAWVLYLGGKGFDVKGIEHDENLISVIKKYTPNLPVQSGDVCRLPFKDCSMGAYISLGVVEHFEDGAERPLKEAWRVLRPGGILILTVPFNHVFRRVVAHPMRALYLLVHRLRGGAVYFAEYRYSETEAREMVEKAGFKIIETGTDDYSDKSRSMVIWSELPLLRAMNIPHDLNMVGRIAAFIMNLISKKILSAGILVVAQTPL